MTYLLSSPFPSSDVRDWVIVNMLGINDTKPDFSVLGLHIDYTLTTNKRSMRPLEPVLQSSEICTRPGSILLRMV